MENNDVVKNILIVSHLYLFPNYKIYRGGGFIHETLKNLNELGCKVCVIFFIPKKTQSRQLIN